MIGWRAVILDLLLPLVWVGMALAAAAVIVRKRNSANIQRVQSKGKSIKGVLAIGIVVLSVVVGSAYFINHVQRFSVLQSLSANSVESIKVGEIRVTNASDTASIVEALRSSQWYVNTAGGGGWARPVDIVIHFRSGEETRYPVGQLLKHDSAVIEFVSQDQHSNFVTHHGYAISSMLPKTLERIGTPLPR